MRLSLRLKILGGFAAVALVSSLAGGFLLLTLRAVEAQYQQVMALQAASRNAADLQAAVVALNAAVRGYLAVKNEERVKELEDNERRVKEEIQALQQAPLAKAQRGQLDEIQGLANYYVSVARQIFTLVDQGMREMALATNDQEATGVRRAMTQKAAELSQALDEQAAAAARTAHARAVQAQWVAYGVLGAALVLVLGLGTAVATGVARPVQRVAAVAQRVAAGDLTVEPLRVRSRDEVGQMAAAVNQMVESLRRLIERVGASTQEVMAAAEELSAASEQAAQAAQGTAQAVGQVAAGTAQQSESAADVRRTMEELQRTIQQIASGASRSAAEVTGASQVLEGMARSIAEVADGAAQVAQAAGQAAGTARAGPRRWTGPWRAWTGSGRRWAPPRSAWLAWSSFRARSGISRPSSLASPSRPASWR